MDDDLNGRVILMNDNEKNEAAASAAELGDLSGFFAPSWAKDDGESHVRLVGADGRPRRNHDVDYEDRPPRREGEDRRGPRPPRREGEGFRADRPPRREGEGFRSDRPPRREGDGDERRVPRPPRREGEGEDHRGPRPPRRDGEFRQERPPREPPLTLDVRFLPDGRALDAIIRRIQTTGKAYPFRDIVKLFQKDDASLAVRIEADKAAGPSARMFQCRSCGLPALSEAELAAHLMEKHFADFFDAEVVEGEPPSGNFPCVARCGLSGEWLGPPNHHTYKTRIDEVLADKFPGMDRDEFMRHVEMLRDPESVEQWREAACKRTLYFRKPEKSEKPEKDEATPAQAQAEEPAASSEPSPEAASGDAPAAAPEPVPRVGLSRKEAEAIFVRDIAPGLSIAAAHIVCPAQVLKNMPNRRLASFLNGKFAHDEAMRSQGTLSKAIHGAFHRRKLHFFHANDEHGQEFVTLTQPVKLGIDNVTAEIKAIAAYVEANPCCTSKALLDALASGADEEASRRMASSLRWLIEKGHIVEFFNGFLTAAAQHPAFSLSPKAKPAAKAPEATPVEADAPSAPAEPPAPEPAPAEAAPVEAAADPAAAPSAPAESPAPEPAPAEAAPVEAAADPAAAPSAPAEPPAPEPAPVEAAPVEAAADPAAAPSAN